MLKDIPKFVINLDRKTDRLESVDREMKYIGWEYERFSAVDTDSYVGCAMSYMKLAQLAIDRKYDHIMIFEDDIFFMPYAKDTMDTLDNELFNKTKNWDIFHFGPSLNRPIDYSSVNKNLLDMTNTPPKQENHTGIYNTCGLILSKNTFEFLLGWNTNEYTDNSHMHKPIDVYLDCVGYSLFQTYTYKLPLAVQKNGYSDINKTFDNNYFLIAYNWGVYTPEKLSQHYLNQDYAISIKKYEN
jgi:GR25 family glycosyltransferase involved in LPS biosynthesis